MNHLERYVVNGAPGDRLPSVRALMAELGVSPATVRQAVSQLVRAGTVDTVPGSGTFVAVQRTAMPDVGDRNWQATALGIDTTGSDILAPVRSMPTSDTIDLASGYPDTSIQPVALVSRSLREMARRPATFGRAPGEGIPALRDWFAEQIASRRSHTVLIMPGGQSALSLVFRSLTVPGDIVLMESPTYVGAIATARSAGLVLVPVPADDGGMLVDQLAATIERTGAKVLYIQPRFHNPTGVNLAGDRHPALMKIASRYNLMIVEDDWLYDLDDPATAPRSLVSNDPDGHVINIRSLTKSISPAIRIAGVAAAGAVANRLWQTRSTEDFFVSPILQEIASNVVTSPGWPGHLRHIRATLAERQRALVSALSRVPGWTPRIRRGPLHIWLDTPDSMDADVLRDAALRHGVAIVAGTQWHPSDAPKSFIRLSSAAVPMPLIEVGASRLAEAIDSVRT